MRIRRLQTFALFAAGLSLAPAFGKDNLEMADGSAQQGTIASQPSMSHDEAARRYFSDRKLTTQDGRQVKFYTDLLKDKVVLIQFIFTRCTDACPLTTKQLADTQKLLGERLGEDIFFLSISVDPQRDTPEQLKAYSQRFNAEKGWLFLTGHKEDVDQINRKLGQVSPVVEGHLPIFLLGNVRTGHWLKMQPYSASTLIAEQLLTLADEK